MNDHIHESIVQSLCEILMSYCWDIRVHDFAYKFVWGACTAK